MDNRPDMAHFLDEHRDERHMIVLHSYPDPDSIASAYVHQLFSDAYDIETTIIYTGKIVQRQYKALVKLLGVDIVPYGPDVDLSGYQGAIFIDHQGETVRHILTDLDKAGIPVLAIIDHHELGDHLQPAFVATCRAGSTATIYADYIRQKVIELDKSRKDHVSAATALLYGILSETDRFISANEQDFLAAAFLSRYRDIEFLEHIMSQARTKQIMEIIRRALGNRIFVESFSIAGIGYLRSEDREAIQQAADFLLTEENVHTAIVFGIMKDNEDEVLIGSVRTTKITLYPDEFIKDIFGNVSEEQPDTLERLYEGTFKIPVGFLKGEQSERFRELKWKIFDAQVKYKIFAKIGVQLDALP